ncbi:MAG: hypothetical protein KBT00_00950 [Bacteroidales bacterium]|nr:hypothetical protein [Candidatus Cacconaster merdequi]
MKRIIILVSLLALSITNMQSQNTDKALWRKVAKAQEAGKPQTAAGYLKELEQNAIARADDLERLYVSDKLYNELRKYNWKEANAYYPENEAARNRLFDDLEGSIARYASHPRAIILLYERLERHRNDVYRKGDKATGDDWKAIHRECRELIATNPPEEYKEKLKNIVSNLDRKSINFSSGIGQTAPGKEVVFTINSVNIAEATLSLYKIKDGLEFLHSSDGKELSDIKKHGVLVSASTLDNFRNEYAIDEKIECRQSIPETGTYVLCVSSGNVRDFIQINASNIAAASRRRDGKVEVYAADITSGKPYGTVTAILLGKSEEVTGNLATRQNLFTSNCNLNGFTDIRTDTTAKGKDPVYVRLEKEGDKGSPAMELNPYYYDWRGMETDSRRSKTTNTIILTDRSLYKPSDTIRFKVICYSSDGLSGGVLANKPVEVTIQHVSDNTPAAKVTLITNDMGSASGFFTLKEGAENGSYRLKAGSNGYSHIRVESYIRPTFGIEFESSGRASCFGDIVSQSGKIESYAGYPVAGGKIEYEVVRRSHPRAPHYYYFKTDTVAKGTVIADDRGGFVINFPADRPEIQEDAEDCQNMGASFSINVKATDPQGETHESSISIPVADIPLDLEIKVDGGEPYDGMITVIKDSTSSFIIEATTLDGTPFAIDGKYEIRRDNHIYRKDSFHSNSDIPCFFGEMPSGVYTVKAEAEYRGKIISSERRVLILSPSDKALPLEETYFYHPLRTEGAIDFLLGTSEEDLYLNLEILDGHKVLHTESVHLRNEMKHFDFPFLRQYGTHVTLHLLGFRNGEAISHEYEFTNPHSVSFSTDFSFFRDRTAPGSKERITITSAPGSETVVSIFDFTTDRYEKNSFRFNMLEESLFNPIPTVALSVNGGFHSTGRLLMMSKGAVNALAMNDEAFVLADSAAEEETPEEDAGLRTDFSGTLAFFPHLTADGNGSVSFEYCTNDLLGRFRVLAFSHTKDLKTGYAENFITVQKPLMVIPSLPLFAREGDRIAIKARIVNISDKEVKGTASAGITDINGSKLNIKGLDNKNITLPAGGQHEVSWNVTVPAAKGMKVKILFAAGKFSDGEENIIRIEPKSVTVTEAASFVIGGPHGFDYYEKDLRKEYGKFNPSFRRAEYSTLDAVKESLPEAAAPESGNAIDWMNQLYISQMRSSVLKTDEDAAFRGLAMSKLDELQGSQGGFKWFGGMEESSTTTLYILEKMAHIRDAGAISFSTNERKMLKRALAFIDRSIAKAYSAETLPYHCSLIRTMSVRSRWLEIPLGSEADKGFRQFLEGTKDGWQNISILEKAQLCRTLQRTRETQYWDKSFTGRIEKLGKSLEDYAVSNPTVGCFFPNAVMPFRGLMNSEIYAHANLMEVFSALGRQKVVDGIAQWILLQKHNQAWENTVATTDAVNALLSSKAKDLRLGAVYCTYTTDMSNLQSSANEISIERTFTRVSDLRRLKDGDIVSIGDKIVARYVIHNSENRSFVRLRAMRPASFYPKDERSSYSWAGYFRQVKESCTEYFWELLPEEETIIEEQMYVTQEGVFSSGIAEIESLYAEEYRGHTSSATIVSD